MRRFVIVSFAFAAAVAACGDGLAADDGHGSGPSGEPAGAAPAPSSTSSPSSTDTSAPPGDDDAAPPTSTNDGGGDAAAAGGPKTFISKRGSLIFSDDFSSGSLAPNWSVIGGTWAEANGLLTGSAPPGEPDPNVGHMSSVDRAVIQFTFRYAGTGQPGIRLNHKETDPANNAHRLAVRISPATGKVTLTELSGWGPTSKSTVVDTGTVTLKANTSYTGVLEVFDRNVAFGIDGTKIVSAMIGDQSATPRNHFVLAAYGDSVSYDDVHVWTALP